MHAGGTSPLEAPPPPFPLLQLPGPALQSVLQQLHTCEAALSAARTCSQLHAAAAAALSRLEAVIRNGHSKRSLLLYLERYGQHVSSLELDMPHGAYPDPPQRLTRLPASCGQLQALSLTGGGVQLGASDSQPGVLQAASALTSMCIIRSTMADSAQGAAAAVARLTRLQRMELVDSSFAGAGVLPGSMLAPLTALTALQLWGRRWLRAATLEHLSSLRGLWKLDLSPHTCSSPLGAALTAAQHLQQLTALQLWDVEASHLTGLSSSLRRLKFGGAHSSSRRR